MTKREISNEVRDILADAGYSGDVSTWPRKYDGTDHTTITHPSDGAFEYLTGYLGEDALVIQHPFTQTITITWRKSND